MKIAFDATALYGRLGGVETALWQGFHFLAHLKSSHEFVVFAPRDAPNFGPFAGWDWRRLPFDGAQKKRRIVWQQCELPRILRHENFDLLHSWNYVAPLLSPVPTVLTVQDLIALNAPHFALRANRVHYRMVMPQSLKRAARVLTTTQRGKNAILRRAPQADCRVIPLGVDPVFLAPVSPSRRQEVREKYRLPARFLLFAGNFEPKKNLPRLLEAVKQLTDAPPLVVAGGIKPWPVIERQLKGIQRLGWVERDDLPVLMSECAAFCFPSLCEGFGLPVLEALAAGAQVVASSAVPLPDLEKFAFTPNPRFSCAITRALSEALTAPKAGGIEYASGFSWQASARRTLAVYEEFAP